MQKSEQIEKWFELFPELSELEQQHQEKLKKVVLFKRIKQGDIAYEYGWECNNFLMCLDGRTRVYRSSDSGREILLYRVASGETCVLTTSCLMANTTFPAESIAEKDTLLAGIPFDSFNELMAESELFRKFVHNNYGELLSDLILLVNEVAFSRIDMRLAGYLLKIADSENTVHTTHQQLAQDMGSVREVISRHLNEWERDGWIDSQRGKIQLLDKEKLTEYSLNS